MTETLLISLVLAPVMYKFLSLPIRLTIWMLDTPETNLQDEES